MNHNLADFAPNKNLFYSENVFGMGVETNGEAHPMALLLEEYDDVLKEPCPGDIRTGIVVDKRSHELLIDIGYKSEGIVGGREIERISKTFAAAQIGDEIPVFIMREDKDGNVLLSISRAQAEQDWTRAEELLDNQEIFEGMVTAHNRGGVIVSLGQVRGFVPSSQLSASDSPNNNSNASPENRWAYLLNQPLKLKVIDLDRKRNRLILSERLAMREWRRVQKEKLLDSVQQGDTLEGEISSIADFGAFVDLGGADGLIHLSELSWGRVTHPNEVVQVGQKVNVQILNVDMERRRIGLSLRRLQPQPWDLVQEMYEVGQIVRGKITKLVNFGAFARLSDDGLEDSNGASIEGLIHISELSDMRVTHPKEIVSEGEEYDLRIIRIDIGKRRMGLSLKQALPPKEEVELDWEIAPSEASENGASSEPASDMASEVVAEAEKIISEASVESEDETAVATEEAAVADVVEESEDAVAEAA